MTLSSSLTLGRPYAAAYSEYTWFTSYIQKYINIERWFTLHYPSLSASGSDMAPEEDDVDVTGLVVGVVFGSAAAALLVLGGWFVLKKFYWAGGLHAFDWQIDRQTVFALSPQTS